MDNEKLKRITVLFKKLNEEINQMEESDKCNVVIHNGAGIHKNSLEFNFDKTTKFVRIENYRIITEIIDDGEN